MITKAKTFFAAPAQRGRLFYFLYWGALASFGPFLNVYFSKIGMSGVEIGLLAMFSPLATLAVSPLVSMMADRHQWHRRILAICMLGVGAVVFLYQFPRYFLGLAVLSSLYALFFSPMTPLADGLIARMSSRYKVDFGTIRLWGSMSFAILSLACGALWEWLGFGAMFAVAGLLYVPGAWMALRLEGMRGTSVHKAERMPLRRVRQDRGIVALLVATFLIGISESAYVIFSGVYVDRLGGGQFLVGLVFGLSALAELPTMQISGRVIRRLGHPKTLLLAYGLLACSYFGYAFTPGPGVVPFFAMLKGVGFSFYFITSVSLVDRRAPEDGAATLQSLVTAMSWGLAPLLMAPLGGWISDAMGLPTVFIMAGISALLAGAILGGAYLRGHFEGTPLKTLAPGG